MQKGVIVLEPIHVIGIPYLDFPLPPLFPFALPQWPHTGGPIFMPEIPKPPEPAPPGPVDIANALREQSRAVRFPHPDSLSADLEAEIELNAAKKPGSKSIETRRKEAIDELFLLKYHQAMNQDTLAKSLLGHNPLSNTTEFNVARYEALYGSATPDNNSFKERFEASYDAAWTRSKLILEAYALYVRAFNVSPQQLILGRVPNASPDEIRKRVRDRVAAEAAAKAEAERIAAEAAARAEAERIAAEAAAKAETDAKLAGHILSISNAGTNVQLGTTIGAIAIATSSGITFEAALQGGMNALKAAGAVLVDRALGVGIGALFYSPVLGNGDLYPELALSMPASSLLPDLPENLNEVATAQGEIDLPYRIYGSRERYTLVATAPLGTGMSKVPVRALRFEPTTNSYISASIHALPIPLTFPITQPGKNSTTTPNQPNSSFPYTGVILTPLAVEPETFPTVEQLDFLDCVYCFPADSGLPPIYVVFNAPYEGATIRGQYSGRPYDPEQAGGPTLDLDWTSAKVTKAGIDLIRLHTSRFKPSDANAIMIDRLERIVRGELSIADVDKRFYTHEIRELERFRALGIADGLLPEGGVVWNNTHTATLEDYKLVDAFDLFYTPEAIEADDKQIEREEL